MRNLSSTEANQDNEEPLSQERAEMKDTDSLPPLRYLRYLMLYLFPVSVPPSFPLLASVDLGGPNVDFHGFCPAILI
jgi:hypothetical protein